MRFCDVRMNAKCIKMQLSPSVHFFSSSKIIARSLETARKKSSATLSWLPKEAQLDFKDQKSEL